MKGVLAAVRPPAKILSDGGAMGMGVGAVIGRGTLGSATS